MAMTVSQSIIGVDVAKAEVVIYQTETDELKIVPNTKTKLKAWLDTLPAGSAIAIEATNIYHLQTVTLAHSMGHKVYVVDGFRLNHYRKSTGGRAKTDASDARLLARYLKNEQADLRVWSPPPKIYTRLQSLLRRRAALVKTRIALNQSWAGEPLLKASSKSVSACLERHEALIEKRILDAVTEAGLLHQVKRCQAVEGIGFLTAVALTMAFQRGEFESADAYIAFLGLDLRVTDSGQMNGRRALSKKGDGEIRRLLHNAASAGIRSKAWKPLYEGYLARGLKTTQALVIIARKLARIAFSLMKNQSEYQSKAVLEASPQP
ncbi:Transposase [Pseudomonas antarctica]|jgi:transposase|uniref:Transposase n=9 Tax=Pseudomonadaceae TaxID=135621 RepID=A0A1G9Y024_9PSED|nr:IS110 family transposase [Pseudomonas antarctica]KAF2405903.1 transposase [Pseudomonas antarctica]KAF2406191.1 transposase [Pseudomonas antarctica]KAF2406212.1 transposase [Pseudomonas antarctica]KAF2406465.1 transposase [Pseudomonas antarctica]KAF2406954.1 transposase [Pseudomonas antarctica]